MHKSIKQDYKIWALEDLDYIFNWLWHSRILSTENLSKQSCQKIMTDTQTLIMFLAKNLSESAQDFILYLNNLFINLFLATAFVTVCMLALWIFHSLGCSHVYIAASFRSYLIINQLHTMIQDLVSDSFRTAWYRSYENCSS